MKSLSIKLLFLLTCSIFLLFILFPDLVQTCAHESVLFCTAVLIPSLFPGFVLADLLITLSTGSRRKSRLFEKIFRLPSPMERCLLIGLLAGFPAAADCAIQLFRRGEATKEQTERCLAFTNNPGIVFVVCAVGTGIFGSLTTGLYLWAIQTLSALLIGVAIATPQEQAFSKKGYTPTEISIKQMFPKAVVSSVSSVLNVCGFVIFFRVIISVFTSALPLDKTQALLAGLLEITCGVSQLKSFHYTTAITTSLILGWSGFSVHFQILNRIAQDDLSVKFYFLGKVMQALLSAGLTACTYPLFFSDKPVSTIGCIVFITLVIFIFTLRFRKESLWKAKSFSTKKNV